MECYFGKMLQEIDMSANWWSWVFFQLLEVIGLSMMNGAVGK